MKYIQTYSPKSIAIARNDTWPYKTMADIKAGRGVNVIFTGTDGLQLYLHSGQDFPVTVRRVHQ